MPCWCAGYVWMGTAHETCGTVAMLQFNTMASQHLQHVGAWAAWVFGCICYTTCCSDVNVPCVLIMSFCSLMWT
jgi:hypothetical protein